jgi:hypothetical protein
LDENNLEKAIQRMDDELHEETTKGRRVRFNMNSAKT